ncbi:uncharacterized protein BDW70DRAFT_165406 [Aspergillus foveolatus]
MAYEISVPYPLSLKASADHFICSIASKLLVHPTAPPPSLPTGLSVEKSA